MANPAPESNAVDAEQLPFESAADTSDNSPSFPLPLFSDGAR
jgi:hypothetical protein